MSDVMNGVHSKMLIVENIIENILRKKDTLRIMEIKDRRASENNRILK